MLIRPAHEDDAGKACEVLRRSIVELCEADHHGDPDILMRWLANKTIGNVAAWIRDPDHRIFVADDGGRILAVGGIKTSGEITLNYVSPDARFRGVSRAMMARLEETAAADGHDDTFLTSTQTARRFYLSIGYRPAGEPQRKLGTDASYPMRKQLPAGA